MKRTAAILGALILAAAIPKAGTAAETRYAYERGRTSDMSDEEMVHALAAERMAEDEAALRKYRPGYSFWQYVYTIPDGSIAFGSAEDGRLIASFPVGGDWIRGARWADDRLETTLNDFTLAKRVTDRRNQVAEALESQIGAVIDNATRGNFLLPNARRYGGFLAEWSTIYERFGVPADVGLAQAIVESGLSGRVKSEARAIGFCQWLPGNWDRLVKLSGAPIEAMNQTTQAPYCAAYLAVLATKYGSFIPALSEHHAGGTNVGRTVINGERLGGADIREQYFKGSDLAVDLRALKTRTFRQLTGTFGSRSHLYSEMVFGNTYNVKNLRETMPQDQIYAMRTTRAYTIDDLSKRTGFTADQLKRFNPALVRQVPKGAILYLPTHNSQLGTDVSFWHRPASPEYAAVLNEFMHMKATPAEWEDPAFDAVLRSYRQRFKDTSTEEGAIMSTVIAYVMQEMPMMRRILTNYRSDPKVQQLLVQGTETLGNVGD